MNVVNFPNANVGVLHRPNSPLYFEARETPLYTARDDIRFDVTTHKAIVRDNPNEEGRDIVLGIVGSSYKLIQNVELYTAIEAELEQAFDYDQLCSVQVADKMSYLGGICFRQYIFPNIKKEINKNSSILFRVVVVNGFDGSSSFKLLSGAIDAFCTNGMIHGVYDAFIKRHTASLTIPKIAERVRGSIDIFYKNADIYRKWANTQLSDEQAEALIAKMPQASERFVAKMMRQYHIEKLSHGPTVWALYSAATYYASHNEGEFATRITKNDHTAATLHHREMAVRNWSNSMLNDLAA